MMQPCDYPLLYLVNANVENKVSYVLKEEFKIYLILVLKTLLLYKKETE